MRNLERYNNKKLFLLCLMTGLLSFGFNQANSESVLCGDQGVWIQILGAGGSSLDDGQASASYLVWNNGSAKLLVDPSSGSTVRFDESGANFSTIEVIAISQLTPHHSSGLPSFIEGALTMERKRALTILGPEGNNEYPDTKTFLQRMIGKNGAYPYLSSRDISTGIRTLGFNIKTRNIASKGRKEASSYANQEFSLSAIPVHHGNIPALAWRVEIGGQKIIFAGDLNNQKNVLPNFAENSDALIITHAIPDTARGRIRDYHLTPTQIGRIASMAGTRMVILGHRTNRTRGYETQTTKAIEDSFKGPLIFANDMECWGL